MTVPQRAAGIRMMRKREPRLRTVSTFQKVVFLILLVYVLNLAEGVYIVVKTGQWSSFLEKLFSLIIFGIIAYLSWRSIVRGRESYPRCAR